MCVCSCVCIIHIHQYPHDISRISHDPNFVVKLAYIHQSQEKCLHQLSSLIYSHTATVGRSPFGVAESPCSPPTDR